MNRVTALLVFVLAGFPAVVRPSPKPDLAAIAAAERQVAEIFGADLKAARTLGEHAALARKLTETAKGTSDDPAAAMALYLEAQRQATAAGDMALMVEVLRTKVGAFPPAGTVKELIAGGNDLWGQADATVAVDDKEARKLRLAAAEKYLAAQARATGLDRVMVEKRIGELGKSTPSTPELALKETLGWRNLLPAKIVPAHVFTGAWKRTAEGVRVKAPHAPCRLWIPVRLPDEYDLRCTFVHDGDDVTCLIFPLGNNQVLAQLYDRQKVNPSGLSLVNGKAPQDGNKTQFRADLEPGKEHTVTITVRRDGELYAVTMTLDGVETVRCEEREAAYSIQEFWKLPGRGFGIGAHCGESVVFSSLQFRRAGQK